MALSLSETLEDIYDDIKDAVVGNQRKRNLIQFAAKYDFDYNKRISIGELDLAVLTLNLFKTNRRQRLKNILAGNDQKTASKILIFDTELRKPSKKATTCVLLESDLLNLPRFCLRPKRSFEKVAALFKTNQHSLAKYPELQKSMVLEAKHLDYVQRYLTDQLAAWLLDHPDCIIEGIDDWVLIYQENTLVDVSELLPFSTYTLVLAEILLFDHSNDLV